MLLINAPGPTTQEFVFSRFWLAEARKWFPLNLANKADNPKRLSTVLRNPPDKSSNAEGSNSKLLNDGLAGKATLALRRRQEALLHRFRFEQICWFALRSDFAPQFDGHDYSGRFPGLIGNDLDIRERHNFSLACIA